MMRAAGYAGDHDWASFVSTTALNTQGIWVDR